MKRTIYLLVIIVIGFACQTPERGTGFEEPEDPNPIPVELWQDIGPGLHVAVGSIDNRYDYHVPPETSGSAGWSGSAWRGERVNIQVKLWSSEPVSNIRVSCNGLSAGRGQRIGGEHISIYPVRFVLTDEFLTGCGWRDHDTIPAHLASDMLEFNQPFNMAENTLRPVWITIDVPAGADPGDYSGSVRVSARGTRAVELPLELKVFDLELPGASGWGYHLDLWQNPFAVARYYGVAPWSEEHWSLLPPYLEMLAGAGQKCITASILHRPWGGQTYDHFESKIDWIYLGNGEWEFDYSVFDRWVELAMAAGITRQINCYSMVPWGNQLRYFDANGDEYVTVTLQPGSAEYVEMWTPFLQAFREHLRERGWLERTLIAMDERGLGEMQQMIALLQDVAPELRIAYAGNYYEEINDDLYDFCVFHSPELDTGVIAERVGKGWPTTFYTMCARPEHPNNFTFSPPAEQAWLGWYAAARGFNGYLRWAYNSWVEDPVRDSRFRTWPAGDTYQVYPGPRSSIRFERLREGIQDYEKVMMLRAHFISKGQAEALAELDHLLSTFTIESVQHTPAATSLNKGKAIVEKLSERAAPKSGG